MHCLAHLPHRNILYNYFYEYHGLLDTIRISSNANPVITKCKWIKINGEFFVKDIIELKLFLWGKYGKSDNRF